MTSPLETEIMVPLVDEGVEYWRPAPALQLNELAYTLLGFVPEEENWQFQPGDIVRCEIRNFEYRKQALVAVALHNEA